MKRHRVSGASLTETIIVVTAIAIVMIVALTVYGQRISAMFRGASTSLDRGEATRREGPTSHHDIYTDTTIAIPRGTTNTELAAANAVASIGGLAIDPALSESDRNRLLVALNNLPPAVRDAGIAGITQQGAQNAFFNPGTNRVEFGPFAVEADGEQQINDFFYAITGQNQEWSVERVLYHEMIHAVESNNQPLADSFLNIGYNAKYAALQADPALAAAQAAHQAAFAAIAAAHVPPPPLVDGAGTVNINALQRTINANPALAQALYAANDQLTQVVQSHGLPSRYPGDTHAGGDAGQSQGSGRSEYFAMVMETARYQPAEFQRWRDLAADGNPANDILSPAEIAWIDAHPELR